MRIKTQQITTKEFNYLCGQAAARGSFYERYKADTNRTKNSSHSVLRGSQKGCKA